MSYSTTYSNTTSFTATHAKHLAAKIATDLKRVQRLYGEPRDAWITDYQEEAIQLLKGGYLSKVTYGFKRSGKFIEPTICYLARDLASLSCTNDDPGSIRPGADISGAAFTSYLLYSDSWSSLTQDQQGSFKDQLPFRRVGAEEPAISGFLQTDKTYSAGGLALDRARVRNW